MNSSSIKRKSLILSFRSCFNRHLVTGRTVPKKREKKGEIREEMQLRSLGFEIELKKKRRRNQWEASLKSRGPSSSSSFQCELLQGAHIWVFPSSCPTRAIKKKMSRKGGKKKKKRKKNRKISN